MNDIRWLGVDLGGTKVLAGVFDDDLKLIDTAKQPSNASGGPAAVFESRTRMQLGSDFKSTSDHFSGSASFLTLKPVSARTVIKADSHGGENCLTHASSSYVNGFA